MGMSINWRVFGTSGLTAFEDAPVHRQFVANPVGRAVSRSAKSIFRKPAPFSRRWANTGRPALTFRRQAVTPQRGSAGSTPRGRRCRWKPDGKFVSKLPATLTTHAVAQLNHYMLRSEETFSLKRGTASPVALSNRYQQSYFDAADKGTELDASAFRYAEAFDAMHARAMALPDVARLHALCCADHIRAICEKRRGCGPRTTRAMPPLWLRQTPRPADPAYISTASRMIGQVMQWLPPRPRPSSPALMVTTSTPALRSRVLV